MWFNLDLISQLMMFKHYLELDWEFSSVVENLPKNRPWVPPLVPQIKQNKIKH
jgi:hypothetical protein